MKLLQSAPVIEPHLWITDDSGHYLYRNAVKTFHRERWVRGRTRNRETSNRLLPIAVKTFHAAKSAQGHCGQNLA